jgi:hypothetical protein
VAQNIDGVDYGILSKWNARKYVMIYQGMYLARCIWNEDGTIEMPFPQAPVP